MTPPKVVFQRVDFISFESGIQFALPYPSNAVGHTNGEAQFFFPNM